jgi:phosphonate degradation associated HDIG domain protein
MEAALVADEILDLYRNYGDDDYIGEPVSQAEHMSQCAELAIKQGYDEEVILAAFFHDIGHLLVNDMELDYMDGFGVTDHERIGADYLLSRGFSIKIAKLVNSHVAAKRYLTWLYPEYYEQLSAASKRTLEFQGGKMTAEEAVAFEADDDFDLFLKLRRWDDAAKTKNLPLINYSIIRDIIIHHLTTQSARQQVNNNSTHAKN